MEVAVILQQLAVELPKTQAQRLAAMLEEEDSEGEESESEAEGEPESGDELEMDESIGSEYEDEE